MPDLGQILDILERDHALELDESGRQEDPNEQLWPVIDEDETVFEVDHGRLFPGARPLDRGEEDWEVHGDDWELPEEDVERILGEEEGDRSPVPPAGRVRAPEWDVWAWYQPIHFFGPAWGVYIREAGLVECARRMSRHVPAAPVHSRQILAKAVLRAAFAALYLHESYHHKTESLALRFHVVGRQPVFAAYHRGVYRTTAGTHAQIEEGLANADSWFRITDQPYATWTGGTVTYAARDYLERSFGTAPPGYANASRLLRPDLFRDEQQILFAQVQEGSPSPSRSPATDFGIATHLNHSLFRVNQRVWTIVHAGVRTLLPTRRAVLPLATNRLRRFIEREGWAEVHGAGKGSHRKYRDGQGRMIVLPDRKDVSMPVLSSTAQTLGLSVGQLKAEVGGR